MRSAPTIRRSTTRSCCRSAKRDRAELLLSLTLKWADETRTPLAQALRRITSAPADVLKLPAGRSPKAARPTVFDPRAHWRVEPRALKEGHNSPFLGYELPATVRATLVAGQVAFERH